MNKNNRYNDETSLNEMFYGIGKAKEDVAKGINLQQKQAEENKKKKKITISEDEDLDELEIRIEQELKAIALGMSVTEYRRSIGLDIEQQEDIKEEETKTILEIALDSEQEAELSDLIDETKDVTDTSDKEDPFDTLNDLQGSQDILAHGEYTTEESLMNKDESGDENSIKENLPISHTEESLPLEQHLQSHAITPNTPLDITEETSSIETIPLESAPQEPAREDESETGLKIMFDCREIDSSVYCSICNIYYPLQKKLIISKSFLFEKAKKTLAITSAYLNALEDVESASKLVNLSANAENCWIMSEDIYSEIKALL